MPVSDFARYSQHLRTSATTDCRASLGVSLTMPPNQGAIQILGERSAHFCKGASEGVTSSHLPVVHAILCSWYPDSGPWEEIQESKMPSDQGGIQTLGILLCTLFRKDCERWAPTQVPCTLFRKGCERFGRRPEYRARSSGKAVSDMGADPIPCTLFRKGCERWATTRYRARSSGKAVSDGRRPEYRARSSGKL